MRQAIKERQEFLAKESLAPETKDEMLRFAAEQFEYYASEHRAKTAAFAPHSDGAVAATAKAKVNTEMAAACRYAMSLPK